ncbi:beta-N-acetylhexosaminidase [Lentisphaera marina]|uniref:beta-N-acetylhexosaminidase n=1 Tax=Lentisphaera marina TaxID=1111041 RepID=UPI00236663BC|nr:beta-N-acetylhexosaminidase [Lentisphaera marina]MDD7986602.1 beta-N-acetylhexosaminidase [Lentisphaera marina]
MNLYKIVFYCILSYSSIFAYDSINIIPQPNSIKILNSKFKINSNTKIVYQETDLESIKILNEEIEKRLGYKLKLTREPLVANSIKLSHKKTVIDESYQMNIQEDIILITGSKTGKFYAIQSLIQLIQTHGENLPTCEIQDSPRFKWRGMHLDVARHMFPVKDIKKFLRWMAYHKLNTFHWHLTEDQGWRIEIKKYPKLTQIGAWRRSTPPYGTRKSDNNRQYGGYYSQEEIKDIVAYAQELHITIVPEIDMPGHMSAAIASYPELGNTDIQYYNPQVMNRWGVYPYILAPKEETFKWIEDVLQEVCELFPSKYIHIGGDEAPKDQWEESSFAKEFMKKNKLKDSHELQSYFIQRLESILKSKGRKLIGWDEIREGGLSSEATVMSWRGEKGGIASAKEGHDVVMTPINFTYFDHYQAPAEEELAKGVKYEAIGGFTPIEEIYSYNPTPQSLTEKEKKHILGTQAQLWSEYMHTWDKVEYMAFPRMAALAEVAWTQIENKDIKHFKTRLKSIQLQYKRAGINYYQK